MNKNSLLASLLILVIPLYGAAFETDHVNDYWDEALNISYYDKLLYPYMKERLLTFCDEYQSHLELFEVEDEEALKNRYQHLQLHDSSELRLNNLCKYDAQVQNSSSTMAVGAN